MPDTQSIRLNFDGITYAKGASVLKQLVAWVGERAFVDGLRAYFRRHEWGNTDLADFLSVLESTSGRDLRAWSAEWLETPGLNTLRATYDEDRTGDAPAFRSFRIDQEAPAEWPTLRSHRLAIGLYDEVDGHLLRRTRVEVDVPKTADVPELVGATIPALTLVNDDDLTYSKIRLDERSMATLRDRMSAIGDPLARALCWASAWDMVRDAELPTGWYVDMVLRHAPAEGDIGTLQRLLGQARAAIDAYGDPALRDERLARVAAAAGAAAAASRGGASSGPRLVSAAVRGHSTIKGLWTVVTSQASRWTRPPLAPGVSLASRTPAPTDHRGRAGAGCDLTDGSAAAAPRGHRPRPAAAWAALRFHSPHRP